MRGGNLGFVSPDGTTPEPGLKLSPAVMAAAQKLKDADMSPEPVADGDRFVILWRKQTMKSVDRPVELEAGSIRQMLLHARTDGRIKETIAGLRKQHLHGAQPGPDRSLRHQPAGRSLARAPPRRPPLRQARRREPGAGAGQPALIR